jgi:hypothetical protein
MMGKEIFQPEINNSATKKSNDQIIIQEKKMRLIEFTGNGNFVQINFKKMLRGKKNAQVKNSWKRTLLKNLLYRLF